MNSSKILTTTIIFDKIKSQNPYQRTGRLNDSAILDDSTKAVTAIENEDYLPINTTSIILSGEKRKTVIVPF